MKKRKMLIWLVVLLVSLLVLGSCGSKDKPVDIPEQDKVDEKQEDPVVEEPELDEEEEEEETPDTVYVKEKVLLDEDDILIKLTGLYGDEFTGPYFTLDIENNSEKDIRINIDAMSVNGIMIPPFFSEKLAAGEKEEGKIELYASELEELGIQLITDVEFRFIIREEGSLDVALESDIIKIEVLNTGDYVQTYTFSGKVVNDGDYKITIGELGEDDFGEPNLKILIENMSKENINVQVESSFVNGIRTRGYISADVIAGKKCFSVIVFDEDELEENDIEKIEEVEISFSIYKMGTYDYLLETEEVKLEF